MPSLKARGCGGENSHAGAVCGSVARLRGRRSSVRPNTSLQPTRNGMALGPGNAFVYDAPHGPSAMPLRAAELERWASQAHLPL